MSLTSPDPWPLCRECERRVTLDHIGNGGVVVMRHLDGSPECPAGAAEAWRHFVAFCVIPLVPF